MFRRNNKTTKRYQAPSVKVTQMALESNFCDTLRFNVQVDELHNMNSDVKASLRDTAEDPTYFEF